MTEEEKNGIPAETPVETTSTEQPAVPVDDGGNFEETDNFGGDVDAAVGFEDNFGLGDQQLSAGRIPSVPSSAPKKKAPAPPVTPRSAEPEQTEESDRDGSLSTTPQADNFDGVNISVDPGRIIEEEKKKLSREEDLFERFQLVRVPARFCEYAEWFRTYRKEHPDAMKNLESMLCDEASVEAVRLGMKRLEAFPPKDYWNVFFYFPYGMSTEGERADWKAHMQKYTEYVKIAKGKYPYFDPPQFFYRHGAIYLDKAVTDRLEGGIFYQCGAFCGASIIAMDQYKPAQIYAFEPSVGNSLFLQANVERAGIENVEMYKLCIGAQTGKVVLPDRDESGKPCKTECPMVPLDFFEEKKEIKGRVAWIQADVGGMSLPVVKGAEKMIKRDKPLITVAIYHNPEEFFGIVPLLHEWVPEYKFMVRRCQCSPKVTYSEITLIAYIP